MGNTTLPWGERVKSCNVMLYGSQVYGTNVGNSDIDRLVISNEKSGEVIHRDINTHNFQCITLTEFQCRLEDHDPVVLEAYIRDNEYPINLGKLRTSFSKVSSNSWSKARKKITQGDFELGIKSAFHAIRLLDFGIQLALNSDIDNWSKYNYVLEDLRSYEEPTWDIVHSKYDTLYKELRGKFKKAAKIENTERWQTKQKIRNLLIKYDCMNPNLVDSLVKIFDYE